VTSAFVSAEQSPGVGSEVDAKIARLRELLAERGAPAAVLTGAAAVAWLTAGITNPIERGHPASPLWLVVTPDTTAALTTNVERPRLDGELRRLGIALEEVGWYEPDGFVAVASELASAPAGSWVTDADGIGHGADDLVALRLALTPPERERLAALGSDATAALEEALRTWHVGEADRELQARAAERLERAGMLGVCLFVGGDERVERFRHPLPTGAPVERLAMAVVVAERGGLHVATTRFASAGRLGDPLARALADAVAIEAPVLDACRVGATYGGVLRALDGAYAAAGHPGAWHEHYQGGPIGYRQREFEIVPTQVASRWFETPLEDGHAVAWNPSVAGGGKVEDTFLVTVGGLRQVTDTGRWPTTEVAGRARPGVLDVTTGDAA
jgi:Xaa-Pro dipeptidase